MSELVQQSMRSAQRYNDRASDAIWGGSLIDVPRLIHDFPELAFSHDSTEFVKGVRKVQRKLIGHGIDGKLGRGTWSAILKEYDQVNDEDNFWVIDDRRMSTKRHSKEIKMINFDQDGGLDLHRFGHFSTRRRKPRFIVVHWGGLNPHHCYRVFSSPNRKVSSHAGIGLTKEGEPAIYQYLDLNHKAWHAGWANGLSVGIDICQQPGLKWEKRYRAPAYNVNRIDNPSSRGPKKILSLDPKVAQATRYAIETLCDALDIPMCSPRGSNGQSDTGDIYHGVVDRKYLEEDFSGVLGHHHISAKKWDVACWWDQVMG